MAGTAIYVAPEVLSGRYNYKCDIWSCGVILYLLLCGKAPFMAETQDGIFDKAKIGKLEFKE